MEKIDLLTLVLLIVAVVVILKLRSVLGRRTGDEEARLERYRTERRQQSAPASPPASDNVITIPRREQPAPAPVAETAPPPPDAETRIKDYPGLAADARRGLLAIAEMDPAFDTDAFIRGARQAYEMIVTAFAEGNRKILKGLLDSDAYRDFDNAISEREARGQQIDQSFVGINKADILDAGLKEGRAHVTMRFVSQLISATRDKVGAVLSGDPQKIKDVTDIWTFQRDVSTPRARENPNWKLVATQAPA